MKLKVCAPDWTNSQGVKITKENVWQRHLQMIALLISSNKDNKSGCNVWLLCRRLKVYGLCPRMDQQSEGVTITKKNVQQKCVVSTNKDNKSKALSPTSSLYWVAANNKNPHTSCKE